MRGWQRGSKFVEGVLTVKGGLKILRCTIGSAKEAGAVMMRMDRDTGMFSARALRSISPKEAASAAKLSWPRHSDMGCAAPTCTCPSESQSKSNPPLPGFIKRICHKSPYK